MDSGTSLSGLCAEGPLREYRRPERNDGAAVRLRIDLPRYRPMVPDDPNSVSAVAFRSRDQAPFSFVSPPLRRRHVIGEGGHPDCL